VPLAPRVASGGGYSNLYVTIRGAGLKTQELIIQDSTPLIALLVAFLGVLRGSIIVPVSLGVLAAENNNDEC
jgi:hypothetical protein